MLSMHDDIRYDGAHDALGGPWSTETWTLTAPWKVETFIVIHESQEGQARLKA